LGAFTAPGRGKEEKMKKVITTLFLSVLLTVGLVVVATTAQAETCTEKCKDEKPVGPVRNACIANCGNAAKMVDVANLSGTVTSIEPAAPEAAEEPASAEVADSDSVFSSLDVSESLPVLITLGVLAVGLIALLVVLLVLRSNLRGRLDYLEVLLRRRPDFNRIEEFLRLHTELATRQHDLGMSAQEREAKEKEIKEFQDNVVPQAQQATAVVVQEMTRAQREVASVKQLASDDPGEFARDAAENGNEKAKKAIADYEASEKALAKAEATVAEIKIRLSSAEQREAQVLSNQEDLMRELHVINANRTKTENRIAAIEAEIKALKSPPPPLPSR